MHFLQIWTAAAQLVESTLSQNTHVPRTLFWEIRQPSSYLYFCLLLRMMHQHEHPLEHFRSCFNLHNWGTVPKRTYASEGAVYQSRKLPQSKHVLSVSWGPSFSGMEHSAISRRSQLYQFLSFFWAKVLSTTHQEPEPVLPPECFKEDRA